MKNYKNKALLLSLLITVLFMGMFMLLSISSYRAFIADGIIWMEDFDERFLDNFIMGGLIAFLPYELIFYKVSGWYSDWFEEETQKKFFWCSITMLFVNVLLGLMCCSGRPEAYFNSIRQTMRYQYIMLFFICLCMGTIICSTKIENKVSKNIIVNFSILLNGILVWFFSSTMGQAIITVVAMCALAIVYGYVLTKKLNWKDVVFTGLTGIGLTIGGLFAKDHHNLGELGQLSKNLFRFDKVDIFMGTGYYILYIFLSVAMVAALVWAIMVMKEKNSIRTGFLIGATALYISTLIYNFLALFEIVPCSEVQIVINRIHVAAFLLVIRCLIIIATPKREEKPSFVERLLSKGVEEDDELEWLMDKVEILMRKQNTLIEYVCVLDLKIQEIVNDSCEDPEVKEAKIKEIEEARIKLIEVGVPMDINELVARFKEISNKNCSKEED